MDQLDAFFVTHTVISPFVVLRVRLRQEKSVCGDLTYREGGVDHVLFRLVDSRGLVHLSRSLRHYLNVIFELLETELMIINEIVKLLIIKWARLFETRII